MPQTMTDYLNNARLADFAYAKMVKMDGVWQVDVSQYDGGLTNSNYKNYRDLLLEFSNSGYQVLDYYTDPATGLAAMLISDSTGNKTLAVRGTDDPAFDVMADAVIAAGLVSEQSTSLENYYNSLKNQGTIAEGELITVDGHSLGGALAQVFTADHLDAVDHAYSINGPGVGGPFAGLYPDENFDGYPITNLISVDLLGQYGIQLGEIVRIPVRGHGISNVTNFLTDCIAGGITIYPETSRLQLINSNVILCPEDAIAAFQQASTVAPPRRDPLILDLDGDGIETVASANGAYFDHDGNGFAERTGWVGSDDGLLVLDRNSDGIINNGTELFGDQTILQNGQTASNGFQALSDLDGNSDGKIDANDAAYSQIRVWQDSDGDGYSYSRADELQSLSDLGIAAIDTGYTTTNIDDGNGNTQVQAGTFEKTDSTTGQIGGFMLQRDTAYTIAEAWLDVPETVAALPDLQGYGNLYDLHQAMARDTGDSLKTLVEQFMTATDPSARNTLMEQILFKWTGTETLDPSSRGQNIDARKLVALEHLLGRSFVGAEGTGNPNTLAAALLNQSYQGMFEMYYSQLMG